MVMNHPSLPKTSLVFLSKEPWIRKLHSPGQTKTFTQEFSWPHLRFPPSNASCGQTYPRLSSTWAFLVLSLALVLYVSQPQGMPFKAQKRSSWSPSHLAENRRWYQAKGAHLSHPQMEDIMSPETVSIANIILGGELMGWKHLPENFFLVKSD